MNLKVFGKNAMVYSLGTILLRVSSFLLIPIYTHYLSISDYGLLSTLLMTIQLMVTIVDFGIRSAMMRFVSKFDSEHRLKELLGSLLSLNILGGVIVLIITVILLRPVFGNILHINNVFSYSMLTCFAAINQSLCINLISYYRARNKGFLFMIINLSALFLLIAGSIVFLIILKRGVPGILLSQVIGYGLLWFFITIHISFKNGLAFSKEVFIMLMKYGFPLIFAMAGNLIMNTSAVYFLGYFFGLEKVAVYTLAFKIASIAEMSVILPFQLAYEPFVFENLEQPGIKNVIAELTTYLFLIFAFVGFAVVFAFRDLIKLVAPADYYPAYYYVFLILPGVAAQGFHYIGQSLLHIERKTYITGITVSSLSFVSIILNFFFIRMFGIYGLVLIYDLTMFAIAVMLVSQGIKTFRVSFEIKRMVMVLVIFVVLLSAVFVFKNISSFLFYPLMLFVVINMIAFLFWGKFIKPKERLFLLSIGKSVKMSSENMFIRKDSD